MQKAVFFNFTFHRVSISNQERYFYIRRTYFGIYKLIIKMMQRLILLVYNVIFDPFNVVHQIKDH